MIYKRMVIKRNCSRRLNFNSRRHLFRADIMWR